MLSTSHVPGWASAYDGSVVIASIGTTSLGWNYTFANQRGETVWTCDQATVCVNMDTMEKQPIPDDLRPGLRHHLEGASS